MTESNETEHGQVSTTSWNKFHSDFSQRTVANSATQLLPYLKPDSRIIDVGCGVGSITLDLAQRVPQGYVLGIDHDEESITTARKSASEQSLTNISFILGSLPEALEQYSKDSFDIAHAHQVLLHMANPIACLKAMRRPAPLVSTRDSAALHFDPSGPTMLENFRRFQASSPGVVYGAGRVHHTWMHAAGFEWSEIETGTQGFERRDEKWKRGRMEGYVSLAEQRGEGEEFLEKLRGDWEGFVRDPGGRCVGVDSWCVGRRGRKAESICEVGGRGYLE